MFKNYIKIAGRNLIKHKLYSAINISGLAVGMACFILVMFHIQDEWNYDRTTPQADQMYRIIRQTQDDNGISKYRYMTSGSLAAALESDFPEVQTAVRQFTSLDWVHYRDKVFQQNTSLIDPNLLDVFGLTLEQGDLSTALNKPASAVITPETAKIYFGSEDPIGKTLTIETGYLKGDYRVTGVLHPLTKTTILNRDIFVNAKSQWRHWAWDNWVRQLDWTPIQTYVQLREDASPEVLAQKLPDFMEQYLGKEERAVHTYHLQPITKIRLYSGHDYNLPAGGDIKQITLFLILVICILLIACINFMNLSTARSAHRAREVGLRKIVGAHRRQIIRQFLGESFFLTGLAFILALGLVELLLPLFNTLIGKSLSSTLDTYVGLLPAFLCIGLSIGLISGSYPALYLSAFQPVIVLKGISASGSKRARLRKILVIFQFAASLILVTSTAVVYQQWDYMRNRHPGFNRDHLIVLPIFGALWQIERNSPIPYERIKQGFLQHPNITKATAIRSTVGVEGGFISILNPNKDKAIRMRILYVDSDFLNTYEIHLQTGRDFSKKITSDVTNSIILNETVVQNLGWINPVGKSLLLDKTDRTVIGIVKDFHSGHLGGYIEPTVIALAPPGQNYHRDLILKVRPENVSETLAFIKKQWTTIVPNRPFQFSFLDDRIHALYGSEKRLTETFTAFSLLAIFLACLGIFGLVAFTAERRTKEIGIRKVLGASESNLLWLISKEFTILVLLANLLAWPVAYILMSRWLQDFAYRINLNFLTFILSSALTLGIVLTTVSYQAFKAARTNPIDSLRYE